MKKSINEIKKMQLLAGLITESEYQESLINPTIVKIEPGRDTGMEFGAIGSSYKITLSDGSVVDSNDDDLLDRYEEVRSGRKSIEQLNTILVGKEWKTYE